METDVLTESLLKDMLNIVINYGVDFSDEGIKYAKNLNIKNAKFYLADAHDLPSKMKVLI